MSAELNNPGHEVEKPGSSEENSKAFKDYRQILESELDRRKQSNPLFSIRAFARWLGMGKTTVSDVIAGRRKLSTKSAVKVNQKLKIDEPRAKQLLRDLKEKRKRNKLH